MSLPLHPDRQTPSAPSDRRVRAVVVRDVCTNAGFLMRVTLYVQLYVLY